jgi:hypothetical protein
MTGKPKSPKLPPDAAAISTGHDAQREIAAQSLDDTSRVRH